MAGLVPAIHVFVQVEDVDARDERGHDGGEVFSIASAATFRLETMALRCHRRRRNNQNGRFWVRDWEER